MLNTLNRQRVFSCPKTECDLTVLDYSWPDGALLKRLSDRTLPFWICLLRENIGV
jgi:hypothetical protein